MAAADKARFYLEKSVPELQELSKKGVFSREEIASIAKKRSDFEHVLNAPGSKPGDYVRYATYEMNLDALRKKRCSRLKITSTTYRGQRTVFFILDRATRKFPGDTSLWVQYVQFCQQEKAGKKLAKVFTSVLRLKPTEWGLWVLAAKHYAERQGDMATARSYLQRGLRFCGNEKRMYMEYAKLEMVYLAKVSARRRILGLDEQDKSQKPNDANDDGDDMIALPELTMEDIDPEAAKGVEEIDQATLKRLAEAPVFTGALPIAIFDAAIKRFDNDPQIAEEFFDLTLQFDHIPAISNVTQHILHHLESTALNTPEGIICEAKSKLAGFDTQSPDFPSALGIGLGVVQKGMSRIPDDARPRLVEKAILLLLPYLQQRDELDEDLVRVLAGSLRRYIKAFDQGSAKKSIKARNAIEQLATRLRKDERTMDAETLLEYCQVIAV